MNTHVDLQTAKLLKEKGFGKWTGNIHTTNYCLHKYFHKKPNGYGLINWKETDVLGISGYDNYVNEYPNCRVWTYAPTIADVVMWLYDEHGIWINGYPQRYIDLKLNWTYSILKIEDGYTVDGLEFPEITDPALIPVWLTPSEAYQKAFVYCLTNLL